MNPVFLLFGSVGIGEAGLIIFLCVIFFGGEETSQIARRAGRLARELRKLWNSLRYGDDDEQSPKP